MFIRFLDCNLVVLLMHKLNLCLGSLKTFSVVDSNVKMMAGKNSSNFGSIASEIIDAYLIPINLFCTKRAHLVDTNLILVFARYELTLDMIGRFFNLKSVFICFAFLPDISCRYKVLAMIIPWWVWFTMIIPCHAWSSHFTMAFNLGYFWQSYSTFLQICEKNYEVFCYTFN